MWLLYSGLSTLFLCLRNVTSKSNVDKTNEWVVLWHTTAYGFPVSLIFLLFGTFYIAGPTFWYLTLIRVILDTIAAITFLKALKLESVSYVIPLLALQPALTIITSLFITNQNVKPLGIFGILITCLASIYLIRSEQKYTTKSNQTNLTKATLLILPTTIIYSVLDPLHAKILLYTNQYTYFFISQSLFLIIITTIALTKSKDSFLHSLKPNNTLITNSLPGIFLAFEAVTLLFALSHTKYVSFVSTIRITNIVLTSLLATIFLKEKLTPNKILVIIAILTGATFITLS